MTAHEPTFSLCRIVFFVASLEAPPRANESRLSRESGGGPARHRERPGRLPNKLLQIPGQRKNSSAAPSRLTPPCRERPVQPSSREVGVSRLATGVPVARENVFHKVTDTAHRPTRTEQPAPRSLRRSGLWRSPRISWFARFSRTSVSLPDIQLAHWPAEPIGHGRRCSRTGQGTLES